jgi:stress-induced morphogen
MPRHPDGGQTDSAGLAREKQRSGGERRLEQVRPVVSACVVDGITLARRPRHRWRGPSGSVDRITRGYDECVGATTATDQLREQLDLAFPDASELSVIDRTGGGDHFQVTVASARFDGLSLVEQHRLVYEALAGPLADGTIHELRIKTKGRE